MRNDLKQRSDAGKIGGKIGGKARSEKLTPEQRKAIAKKAAEARWGSKNKK